MKGISYRQFRNSRKGNLYARRKESGRAFFRIGWISSAREWFFLLTSFEIRHF